MGNNKGVDRSAVDKSREIQEKFFYDIGLLAYKNGDMTDGQIAEKAGISAGYYSEMKNLHKSISLSAMISIARVFGLTVEIALVHRKSKA